MSMSVTDKYALGVLEGMGLKWNLDLETGYYFAKAKNDIRLYLKGGEDSRIMLIFVLGQLGQPGCEKYRIDEPSRPVWKRGDKAPPVKRKLEALLKQAREQCPVAKLAEREDQIRNELLCAAIGWNQD